VCYIVDKGARKAEQKAKTKAKKRDYEIICVCVCVCVCARAQYWVALAALCVRLCACLLVSCRKGEAAVCDVKQSELSAREHSTVRLCMHMFWMDMACMDIM
jgi:hypothetical protein